MSNLSLQHSYQTNDVIDSSDFNDELNQILYAFGYRETDFGSIVIIVDGNTALDDDSILKLDNTIGRIFETTNGTLTSFISANGQITIGASGVGLSVLSNTKVDNLNADLLNNRTSTFFELDLYVYNSFSYLYATAFLSGNLPSRSFIVPENGLIITKLKAQQQSVASANAVTTIEVLVNGILLDSVTINGNTTAVQSVDVADTPLSENDIITFNVTTYTGTTKHNHVTIAAEYKKKFKI